MAEALDSDKIARHPFEVGRRGYEQEEVRAFLHEVSSLVQRLERELAEQRERAAAAEAELDQIAAPDDAMLLERLGEETTRVLSSAREAAADIRAKAEVEAERVVAHATLDAAEARAEAMRGADRRVVEAEAERESLLHDARTELERRRAEADELVARLRQEAEGEIVGRRERADEEAARIRAEAEELLEAARTQGREMVAEAQAVRERVLHDLAVRRKKARRQLEKLNAGRERLLAAYDVVRRLVDEATDELGVSLSDARAAAEAAAQRVAEEPDLSLEQLAEEISAPRLVDVLLDDQDHDDSGPTLARFDTGVAAADPPPASTGDTTRRAGDVASVERTERGRRKGRRRKGGFVGLPPGLEEPPGPRVTLVPAGASAESLRVDDEAEPAIPAEAAEVEADLQRAQARVREAERAAERHRLAEAQRNAEMEREQQRLAEVEARLAEEGARETATRTAERAEAPGREMEPVIEPEPAEAEREAEHARELERVEAEREAARAQAAAEREAEQARERERAQAEAEAGARAAAEQAAQIAERERREQEAAEADEAADDELGSPTVTDLFARLRAETSGAPAEADPVAAAVGAEPAPVEEGEATAFTARAAVLGPIVTQFGRGLKRALADEQNEVLDRLRRAKPRGVDDLLPDADDHAARWAEVAAEALAEAAAAGASWPGGLAGSVADLADELARSLTSPLRDRIDRGFAASDGNLDDVADRVRALYREWKGQRLAETAEHYAAAAYARGLYDALGAKTPVHWAVDPAGVPCPDCDDNVLGGTVPRGTEFPTGHDCAPAHPGCRCLVLATEG